jgi:hypothetical protein
MTEARTSPRRYAFATPPHVTSPKGDLVAWYTSPPGVVVQMVEAKPADAAMVRWLVGPARDQMLQRFPGVTDLILVIDFSLMTTREPAVRKIMSDSAKEMKPYIGRSILVPPANGNAIYLKSLAVSVLLLRGFGVNIELTKSIAFTVTSLGLRALMADGGALPTVPPPSKMAVNSRP